MLKSEDFAFEQDVAGQDDGLGRAPPGHDAIDDTDEGCRGRRDAANQCQITVEDFSVTRFVGELNLQAEIRLGLAQTSNEQAAEPLGRQFAMVQLAYNADVD